MTKTGLEAIQYVLETHIMFSVLPSREKQLLQSLFDLRQFDAGDVVATQGTPVDGMYILYSGRARLKHRLEGRISSVGVVEQEGTLGEMSMLRDLEWPSAVVAIEPITALFLAADKVRPLLAQNPVIEQHFKMHVSLIEVSYRLRSLLGKAKYTNDQFFEILRSLGVKNIAEGRDVFGQGDNDPRLYHVERGAVELVRQPLQGEPIRLDAVHRGGLIGETAALSAFMGKTGLHTYTARALSDVTVFVIPQKAVAQLIEINPALGEKMAERVRQLKAYEDDELQVRKRAEGVDMRIKLANAVTEAEFKSLEKHKDISKFPIVRQNEQSENAAACLTMVCNFYGKSFTLGQIRELTTLGGGANVDQMIKGAETIGFRAKGYALKFEDLKLAKLPAVVGWEGYHYVVVFKVSDREVHICDPAEGIRKIKKDEFLQSWSVPDIVGTAKADANSGLVVVMEPTQIFEKEETPASPIRYFVNFILPYKKFFGEAFLAVLVINLLGLASPLFVQTIVDTVVVHNDVSLLNMMLAGMVLVAGMSTLMTVAQNMLLAHTTARIDMRLMSEFYRHILSLPMDFFLKRNKGEILARFGENQKVRAILTGSSVTVVLNMLMLVIYFLMMFAYNAQMALVVVMFIPLYIAIVLYFTPRIKQIAQEIFLTNTVTQSYLIESLNGIEALKATANEYYARSRWENALVDNVNRGFRQQKLGLMSDSLFKLATLGSSVVVLWIGASQVMSGQMTIGEVMGFNMLMGLVTAPVLQMVGLWNQLQEVRIAVDRVGDVLTVKPEQMPVSSPDKMPATVKVSEGRIVFEKVNFSYVTNDQTKFIMRDFDLEIEPGHSIALVGASGCGKSTIAKMILGFHMPMSGELTIDGKEIRSLDIYSLRRNIGVVLQDAFIFSGTVAENIGLGDPEPDMQAVREAARVAGCDEFIVNFPLGYQTPIGEKGIGLSGGQRQRICIARAMYRKPKIMIFDEATSALDNESEQRITEALKVVAHNRTSISIAHRLSTIMHCDSICYIKDGKVAEKGTHKQLVNVEFLKETGYTGLYYNLARTQFDLPELKLS